MAVHSPKGNLCRVITRNTAIENLIADVSAVPGPKQVVVEECHLSQLVKDTLEIYVDRFVIADPVQNRWIAREVMAYRRHYQRHLRLRLRAAS